MKNKSCRLELVVCACLIAGMTLMSACDDSRTDAVIIVDPGQIEISGRRTVLLTAMLPEHPGGEEAARNRELFLPLEWSVQNPELGGVISRGGHTAVYESSGLRGNNVVFVRDQGKREGLVAVTQN